ncbi:MAG: hypothetical protein AAF383_31495 [Cyanobacteria bacterium P01_A01_bin.83]
MQNLTEIDQLIIICIIAGFLAGVLLGVIDDISGLLINNQRMKIRSTISKSIFLGFAIGVFLSSATFAIASATSISTQELIRAVIGSAIGIALSPIFSDLFGVISLKLFPKR